MKSLTNKFEKLMEERRNISEEVRGIEPVKGGKLEAWMVRFAKFVRSLGVSGEEK